LSKFADNLSSYPADGADGPKDKNAGRSITSLAVAMKTTDAQNYDWQEAYSPLERVNN